MRQGFLTCTQVRLGPGEVVIYAVQADVDHARQDLLTSQRVTLKNIQTARLPRDGRGVIVIRGGEEKQARKGTRTKSQDLVADTCDGGRRRLVVERTVH